MLPLLLLAVSAADARDRAARFLRRAPSPVDYVQAKLDAHRVVILGESHWLGQEVGLVRDLVPHLAAKGIPLATELLPAGEQVAIDRLLANPEWDEAEAVRIQRAADWPYAEYLAIVRTAWDARRTGRSVRVVALGPPANWREILLPQGRTYESFMADLVRELVRDGGRVLVHCGLHHGFTRYEQPEVRDDGVVHRFMDRMGNILRRDVGQDAFLIMFHWPLWCGRPPDWDWCLPLDGAIDCAASRAGRPVAFDLEGSPFGDRLLDRSVYYAHGYGSLRLAELADGYVWPGPLESYRGVRVIPLDVYAPDAAALAEVARGIDAASPPDRERLDRLWDEERARRADPLASRGWGDLAATWRDRCR